MNKLSKVLMIFWTIFCGIGLISGLASVGDVKTTNEFEEAGAAIGTALGLGFWLSLWFFPTAILGIIALITKPKDTNVLVLEKPILCSYCGKYCTGQTTFCPNCGKKISKNTSSVEERKISSGENKKCPFCAELVMVEAKVCKHCGRDLIKKPIPQDIINNDRVDPSKITNNFDGTYTVLDQTFNSLWEAEKFAERSETARRLG